MMRAALPRKPDDDVTMRTMRSAFRCCLIAHAQEVPAAHARKIKMRAKRVRAMMRAFRPVTPDECARRWRAKMRAFMFCAPRARDRVRAPFAVAHAI